MGIVLHSGPYDYWIDTKTGTFGASIDLLLVRKLPDDFGEWSDSERIDYALKQVTG